MDAPDPTAAAAAATTTRMVTLTDGITYAITQPTVPTLKGGLADLDLPTGVRVRCRRHTLRSLLRRELLPDDLADILGGGGIVTAGQVLTIRRIAAADAVRATWDPGAADWRPLTITPEELDDADAADVAALEDYALVPFWTPVPSVPPAPEVTR
jgi:hypothetical protein